MRGLKKLANRTLAHQGVDRKEISILLVDDKTISGLNKQYLKKNYPTDVLAFRMRDGEFSHMHPEILGDVIISLDTASSRAEEFQTGFKYEIQLYLVHGILHLLGCDDKTARGRNKMKALQEEILEKYA
ncbi:MAG: rRNA maturation RNase YbeY [Candidatus Omnitrophica bacterium]|nr:rRNA maturation RNase YbeY [Candidatus Omnitrophota bacterium]